MKRTKPTKKSKVKEKFKDFSENYGNKKVEAVSAHMFNKNIKDATKKALLGNVNGTYSRLMTHFLRKFFIFFITQLKDLF